VTVTDVTNPTLKLIEASENTRISDAIAAHADKRAGKPVTTTDAAQLEALLGVPVRIRRTNGTTSIAWANGTDHNPWLDECWILIAHSGKAVRWPSGDELRKKDPAYVSARDECNELQAAWRELLSVGVDALRERRYELAFHIWNDLDAMYPPWSLEISKIAPGGNVKNDSRAKETLALLLHDNGYTLGEVGRFLGGLSVERARQLEQRGLRTMARRLCALSNDPNARFGDLEEDFDSPEVRREERRLAHEVATSAV